MASAAARVAAIEASLPPIRARDRRARARAGGADRRASGAAAGRSVAAGVSAAGQGAVARRPVVAAAPASGRARRRAAAGRGDRARRRSPRPTCIRASRCRASSGLLAGRGSLFGSADSRAWAVTPALELGGVRPRQRPGAAARRRGGDARDAGRLRADGAARDRGDGERAGRLSRAAGAAGEAGRPGARERARGGHRARPLSRRGRRTSWRCSTPSARSCRRRTRWRRPKPASSRASSPSTRLSAAYRNDGCRRGRVAAAARPADTRGIRGHAGPSFHRPRGRTVLGTRIRRRASACWRTCWRRDTWPAAPTTATHEPDSTPTYSGTLREGRALHVVRAARLPHRDPRPRAVNFNNPRSVISKVVSMRMHRGRNQYVLTFLALITAGLWNDRLDAQAELLPAVDFAATWRSRPSSGLVTSTATASPISSPAWNHFPTGPRLPWRWCSERATARSGRRL